MTTPELEQLWKDPRHWTAPGIYRCAEDPRVIVPKRWRWGGWTINFAHWLAWPVLLGSIAIAVSPVLIVAAVGILTGSALTRLAVLGAVAFSIVVLCLGAAWESERRR